MKLRHFVDEIADSIIAGRMELDPFLQWETSEPLRPILRAAISGEPERIASAIVPNDDLVPALPDDYERSRGARFASDTGLTVMTPTTCRRSRSRRRCLTRSRFNSCSPTPRCSVHTEAALQALLIDPVVGSSAAAEAILADFETAHCDLWPALT